MKLFKPFLLKEYGKYFESDKVFIDKILINNVIANRNPENLITLFVEGDMDLNGAFFWQDTYEGYDFWAAIFEGKATIIREYL